MTSVIEILTDTPVVAKTNNGQVKSVNGVYLLVLIL